MPGWQTPEAKCNVPVLSASYLKQRNFVSFLLNSSNKGGVFNMICAQVWQGFSLSN